MRRDSTTLDGVAAQITLAFYAAFNEQAITYLCGRELLY